MKNAYIVAYIPVFEGSDPNPDPMQTDIAITGVLANSIEEAINKAKKYFVGKTLEIRNEDAGETWKKDSETCEKIVIISVEHVATISID